MRRKQALGQRRAGDGLLRRQPGLPGIIAVNVAVFIGYHVRRTAGGIAAALGCVSPCIIIISIIAAFLTNFQDNIYVKEAMNGIAICVVALILDAVLGSGRRASRTSSASRSAPRSSS